MQLRYQYRVTLTPGQHTRAARVFGCRRVVWNDALAIVKPRKASNKLLGNPKARIAEGPYQQIPRNPELGKTLVTQAKKTTERGFLSDAPVGVMQQTLRDLDAVWKAHEDSKTGKRKGPKVAPPKFKSKKDNRQTARFARSDRWAILDDGKLRLPKIGDIKVKWTRDLPSAPSSATLIKDRSGRYWVSFVVETDPADDILPRPTGTRASTSGSPASPCSRTARTSPPRSTCAERRRSSRSGSGSCRANRRAATTGKGPVSRSLALTPPWRMRAGTSTISGPTS